MDIRFNRRLAVWMWLAGMLGVVCVSVLVVPDLLKGHALPLPVWAISSITLVQGALFLALAVVAGVAFAPKVGLRAPLFEAIAHQTSPATALRSQLVPGLLGGLAGGALLLFLSSWLPRELAVAAEEVAIPLYARLLYGAITEELLLRWGLMTLLLWLLWRFGQGSRAFPTALLVWLAIVSSAVLFGVGHLPAAHSLAGNLTIHIVAFVVVGNALFGVIAGWLFWRFGFESAVIAHGLAHIIGCIAAAV